MKEALTQNSIDSPRAIKPAADYVSNKDRDFSNKFYVRWRRPENAFFVLTPEIKDACYTFALTCLIVAVACLVTIAFLYEPKEITAFLWRR